MVTEYTKKKRKLRNKADKLWKEVIFRKNNKACELTGQTNGLDPHHFYPKSVYGHLRYDLDNGVLLKSGLHFAHHHKGDPEIHQRIIEKKGKKWFESLRKKARTRPPSSYQNMVYYQNIIEQLEKINE